jgi:hypothetical protein
MIDVRDAEHALGVSELDFSGREFMSRPILDIKLRLPDGKVVTRKSRNVPGTLEHLYNEGLHPAPKRHLKWIERLGKGPERYLGSYKVRFGYRKGNDTVLDETVEVEVEKP